MKSIAMNQEDFFALSSFMIYPQVCNESNMMAAISGAGTAYPYLWESIQISQVIRSWIKEGQSNDLKDKELHRKLKN
jgi:hypothetical protein